MELKNSYSILIGNLKGKDHLKDITVDGRIIVKRILRKQDVRVWAGIIWPRIGGRGRFL
jgi:hypothetical protein